MEETPSVLVGLAPPQAAKADHRLTGGVSLIPPGSTVIPAPSTLAPEQPPATPNPEPPTRTGLTPVAGTRPGLLPDPEQPPTARPLPNPPAIRRRLAHQGNTPDIRTLTRSRGTGTPAHRVTPAPATRPGTRTRPLPDQEPPRHQTGQPTAHPHTGIPRTPDATQPSTTTVWGGSVDGLAGRWWVSVGLFTLVSRLRCASRCDRRLGCLGCTVRTVVVGGSGGG